VQFIKLPLHASMRNYLPSSFVRFPSLAYLASCTSLKSKVVGYGAYDVSLNLLQNRAVESVTFAQILVYKIRTLFYSHLSSVLLVCRCSYRYARVYISP